MRKVWLHHVRVCNTCPSSQVNSEGMRSLQVLDGAPSFVKCEKSGCTMCEYVTPALGVKSTVTGMSTVKQFTGFGWSAQLCQVREVRLHHVRVCNTCPGGQVNSEGMRGLQVLDGAPSFVKCEKSGCTMCEYVTPALAVKSTVTGMRSFQVLDRAPGFVKCEKSGCTMCGHTCSGSQVNSDRYEHS